MRTPAAARFMELMGFLEFSGYLADNYFGSPQSWAQADQYAIDASGLSDAESGKNVGLRNNSARGLKVHKHEII